MCTTAPIKNFPIKSKCTPSLSKSLLQFLLLQISLSFLEFHINGILQSIIFCIWYLSFSIMLLRFRHTVACIRCSSLLINSLPSCGCLSICFLFHQLTDIWIVSNVGGLFWFGLLCSLFLTIINKAAMNTSIFV